MPVCTIYAISYSASLTKKSRVITHLHRLKWWSVLHPNIDQNHLHHYMQGKNWKKFDKCQQAKIILTKNVLHHFHLQVWFFNHNFRVLSLTEWKSSWKCGNLTILQDFITKLSLILNKHEYQAGVAILNAYLGYTQNRGQKEKHTNRQESVSRRSLTKNICMHCVKLCIFQPLKIYLLLLTLLRIH